MFTITAPAKINLTLEVLGRRPDNYHDIRSVIQTVSLKDSLRFEAADSLIITSNWPDWDPARSLVSRAAALLQAVSPTPLGARLTVTKRIPLAAGLGGDSSDAAVTLVGLNRLWRLKLSSDALSHFAARLGSDVPFFLHGGTALMEGRGEKLTRLPPFTGRQFLLMVPDVPRPPQKTAAMYAAVTPAHYTDGRITQKLIEAVEKGQPVTSELFFNTFENIAFAPDADLTKYRTHILRIGAANLHLAGSGPALFTLLENPSAGENLKTLLQSPNLPVYLVKTEGRK